MWCVKKESLLNAGCRFKEGKVKGMSDVERPDHYVRGRKFEPLDVIEDWGLHKNHYLACVVKYVARYGRKDKDNPLKDLKKAMFYLQREIRRREMEDGQNKVVLIKK